MAEPKDWKQARIDARIEQVKRDYSDAINSILEETNKMRLKGRGNVAGAPVVEGNSLRWQLAWKEHSKISFAVNIIVSIEDDGQQARVGRVWVHRHASTPLDYEGHTPTTRMRRLTALALDEIREAIEAEWT